MATLKRPLDETEEPEETTNGSATTEQENGANGTTEKPESVAIVQDQPKSDETSFFASKKRYRSKGALSMEQDALRRMGMALNTPDFTTEDMKQPPWTDISRKLYREKKTLHDPKKASEWMRWWFKEHDGMPDPPTRGLQSAFVLWQQEKMATSGTTMKDKKERKRLGAEWKALTEEEQAPWNDKLAVIREDFEREEVAYEEKLEAWREEKLARVARRGERTDGEKDCTCVYCIGEDTSNNQGRGRT